MISIEFQIDPKALEGFAELKRKLPQALMRATIASGRALAEYTHEKKLQYPSSGPPVPRGLRHQTGRLGRNVNASAYARPLDAAGTIFVQQWGSNLPYAAKHEYGGTYTEQVRAHPRRLTKMSKGEAQATYNSLKKSYGRVRTFGSARESLRSVREAGRAQGIAYVRAHSRTRTYIERRMFRDARAEVGDAIAREAGTFVLRELLQNKRLVDGQEIRQALTRVSSFIPVGRPR